MSSRKSQCGLLCITLLLFLAGGVSAQEFRATVKGQVVDTSQAAHTRGNPESLVVIKIKPLNAARRQPVFLLKYRETTGGVARQAAVIVADPKIAAGVFTKRRGGIMDRHAVGFRVIMIGFRCPLPFEQAIPLS